MLPCCPEGCHVAASAGVQPQDHHSQPEACHAGQSAFAGQWRSAQEPQPCSGPLCASLQFPVEDSHRCLTAADSLPVSRLGAAAAVTFGYPGGSPAASMQIPQPKTRRNIGRCVWCGRGSSNLDSQQVVLQDDNHLHLSHLRQCSAQRCHTVSRSLLWRLHV